MYPYDLCSLRLPWPQYALNFWSARNATDLACHVKRQSTVHWPVATCRSQLFASPNMWPVSNTRSKESRLTMYGNNPPTATTGAI